MGLIRTTGWPSMVPKFLSPKKSLLPTDEMSPALLAKLCSQAEDP
jgi:hypothetical protein